MSVTAHPPQTSPLTEEATYVPSPRYQNEWHT
jgi:hypothetical protein